MRELRNPALIVIILSSLLIGSATLTRGHEWGDDFASYIMQAQSILNGSPAEFIEHNSFTIFESSFRLGPVAYPWGYPLILTPALWLKGVHPLTLKLPGLFLFAGFLVCVYLWTKDRLTPTEGLLLVSVFAFNPTLLKFTDQILSDIPLLLFTSLGLLLILKYRPEESLWKYLVLGGVLFLAFFVRTTGVILLASFLVLQLPAFLRDQKAQRLILRNSLATILVFLLLWLGTSLIFPNGQGSYLEQLKGLTPTVFKENVSRYFHVFAFFFGKDPRWTSLYYGSAMFFLIGAWSRRATDQPFIIFFVLYFVAMLFWPEWQGLRFIFPLLPIFVYLVFQGIRFIVHQLPDKYQPFSQGVFYGFWLLLIIFFILQSGTTAYGNLKEDRKINGPFDPYSSDVYNFIRAETPPDSVIVFWKPRAMRLFTDRDTFMSTECDRLPLGDYVVISKKAENSQIPPNEIGKCNAKLNKVFENQRFIIYQVPKGLTSLFGKE
jgi:hypothetical protein